MNPKLPPFQRFNEKSINFKKNKGSDPVLRVYLLPIFAVIVFLILLLRLFQLTIVKGAYYRYLAENNRIREIDIEAPRGKILDRKGFMLAYSTPIKSGSTQSGEKTKRIYNDGEVLSHLIGYRQLASVEDLKNDLCETRLKLNDKIGQEGVEKIYDCQLRGKKGKKLVEVDIRGKYRKTITLLPPQEGKTIRLSLDLELQKKAYELIIGKKAAIVATKSQTGEILILVSSPSFNPQDFEENNQSAIKVYLEDKDKPLFNRVTKGSYPPGSTIKPVIASGALEEKVIDENSQVEDTGVITAGPATYGNWYFLQYGKTEGTVDIVKAIRRSNDIFFYKTGERLGEEKIKIWLEKFGFGKKTGIKLDEEEGLIPSSFWKQEIFSDRWYLGDTYNLSIGQGYILVTPLQLNLATAVFASGGYLCKPKLLKDEAPECKSLGLSKKTLNLIGEGMKQACSSGGTGWPLFNFSVKQTSAEKPARIDKLNERTAAVLEASPSGTAAVKIQTACKTGTAELPGKSKLPHAWFTVFAPFKEPEIVLTVLVEEAGEGSNVAAPIAKEILKSYFERRE